MNRQPDIRSLMKQAQKMQELRDLTGEQMGDLDLGGLGGLLG